MKVSYGAAALLGAALCGLFGAGCDGCGSVPVTVIAPDGGSTVPRERTCKDADLRDCSIGRCTLDAPPGALAEGQTVTLSEAAVPVELRDDAVGSTLCQVRWSAPATKAITLTMETGEVVGPRATLFRWSAPVARAVAASSFGTRVQGSISSSGVFGVTATPGELAIEAQISSDPLSSEDLPALLRNVSLPGIAAATFDGRRLYVASGPRILVYEGIPASPSTRPALVLGQPTLDSRASATSSSVLGAPVTALWSDGTRLAAATGHRILVWATIPTTSFTPADLVLGQQDFSSSTPNAGGLGGGTLNAPFALDGDATHLAVADLQNNRALVWSPFPSSLGQAASGVIGQASPTASVNHPLYQAWGVALHGGGAFVAGYFSGVQFFPSLGTGAAPSFAPLRFAPSVQPDTVYSPDSVAKTAGGGLAIGDDWGARVAMMRAVPTGTRPMDFVLGQPDPARRVALDTSASSASGGGRVMASGGAFFVADGARLLVYENEPTYNFEPASRVLGQAGSSTDEYGVDYRHISARSLAAPSDVAAEGNTVAVADRGNNRVLLYPAFALGTTNPSAAVVLGQGDMRGFVANLDQPRPSASALSGPSGVALVSGRLFVADTENHRVLVWNTLPTRDGAPADLVLGQADFAGHRPNRGRGDGDGDGYSDAGADGLFYPTGIASDGTHLFVADRMNNRVLVWDDVATLVSGMPAQRVLGQGSFSALLPNRGNAGHGAYAPRPDGLNLPSGLHVDAGSLWVADTENNRVVRYDHLSATPIPTVFLGQPGGSTLSNPNYYGLSDSRTGSLAPVTTGSGSVLRPRGLTTIGDRLYVSEAGSHRVHAFRKESDTSYAQAGVVGQSDAGGSAANAGGLGAGSLSNPAGLASANGRLLVVDTGNHRMLSFEATGLADSGASAASVVGQTSTLSNGFNQATTGRQTQPRGIALSRGKLFVAETARHRVVMRDTQSPTAIERVFGQSSEVGSMANAGGSASARTLSAPRAVFADDAHVLVADTGNHRVLVFDRRSPAEDAVRVLGQGDFVSAAPNRGGNPTLGTLNTPTSVWSDGTRVVVADTSNHRVLVWNTFPTVDGQAADLVIGQDAADGALPNRGLTAPSSTTLSAPAGVLGEGDALYVADTGNNRVLRFARVPTSSGAGATSVLGQVDFKSRFAAASPDDRGALAGPTALATDGASLYVVDRDMNRVVSFPLPADGGLAEGPIVAAATGAALSAPGGVAAERTGRFTSRLYVGDTGEDRVLLLSPVSRLLGQ